MADKHRIPFGPSAGTRKPPEPPQPRNFGFEHTFADAIRRQTAVKLLFKGETEFRTFNPHVVFMSQTRKVFVAGNQVDNPLEPDEKNVWGAPEVGRLKDVQATQIPFTLDRRFDPSDPEYRNGVICSIAG